MLQNACKFSQESWTKHGDCLYDHRSREDRSRRSGQGHPQFSLLRPDSIAGAAVRVTAARTDKLSPVGGGGTSQTGYLIMRPTRQISLAAGHWTAHVGIGK